jgi:ribosome maturation factor RimP
MVAERIRACVDAPLAAMGLLVEDVTVTPAGRRRVVRVAVDCDLAELAPDDATSVVPPLDLDEVAEATRAVSDALDSAGVMGQGPYVLEVSSPGVDRPLRHPRHLRRNVGRLVTLTRGDGSTVSGRLVGVDGARATVLAAAGTPVDVPLDQVRVGRVTVEFAREPAPGPAEEDEH